MVLDGIAKVSGRSMRLVVLVAAAASLSACAGRGGPVPYEPANFGPPDPQTVDTVAGPNLIVAGDKLQVTTFQVEDLSGEFPVDSNGRIHFPLVGAVEAQGKTAEQVAGLIRERLGQRYLRNPNVQVSILEAVERTVTVDGSVRQPGAFAVRGPTTLARAVALGGGLTGDANANRVVVFRTVNGQRMAAAFDLQAIRRAQSEDPTVYPNDLIVVDGSRGRRLLGDILTTLPIIGIFRPF